MELNNEEVKKILEQSFEKIMKMQNERGLTFDEIKDLFAEVLYDITLYGKKEVSSIETVEDVSVYGEENTPTVKEIDVNMPQILYGPPLVDEVTTYEMDYNQSKYSQKGSDLNGMLEEKEDFSMEHGSEYIPGTNIWKPRDRGVYESDDDYTAYLDAYYSLYFPKSTNKKK